MYPESRSLRYNSLRNRDELAELFTGVTAQGVGAMTVAQALAQRDRATENDLRNQDLERR